jgi:hypothetical protein
LKQASGGAGGEAGEVVAGEGHGIVQSSDGARIMPQGALGCTPGWIGQPSFEVTKISLTDASASAWASDRTVSSSYLTASSAVSLARDSINTVI